jgi:hypothetical protein
MGLGYFRDQGIDVTLLKASGLSRDPSRIHTAGITDWVSRHLGDGDEALFMAGNGFRAARAVSELEATNRSAGSSGEPSAAVVDHCRHTRAIDD